MTATTQTVQARERHAAAKAAARRERTLLFAVAALMLSACLPLTRVFIGVGFLVPVYGAALLAMGIDWAARRRGAGPGLTLLLTVLGWVLVVGRLYVPATMFLGVLPTLSTLAGIRDAFVLGLELVALTPSPTYAEPGLVLLALTGVWAVAHAVDGLVLRLQAPVAAIVLALVLWTVPLALAIPTGGAWVWAAPFLAASAALLLTYAGADLGRFGRWVYAGDPAGIRRQGKALTTGGSALAGCAIVIGSLVAGSLPGFGERPWHELRGSAGTTLTTNPIVGIRSRLVATDTGPVLRVTSPRPIYVRVTSLDVYDDRDETWTSAGVDGGQVDGVLRLDQPLSTAQRALVDLEVVDLPGAIFVPLPYQTIAVNDSRPGRLRYDPQMSTFFVNPDSALQPGETFSTVAALPDPTVEELSAAGTLPPDPAHIALPEVPEEVGVLAREIVAREGATTRLEQAVAIQDELRTWTYSLDVVANHRRSAMREFLASRTGYCEQFAGTMAVMLRELGIPARVAVGFTPGIPSNPELVGTGQPVTYTVSNANAHTWVEVLFPGHGWIAFEPTPRSDGNVLVPSATNLAPAVTELLPGGGQQLPDPFPRDELNPENLGGANPAPIPGAAQAPGQTGAAGDAGRRTVLVGGGVAVVVLVLGGGLLWSRRRSGPSERSPLERVLRTRGRLWRLGAGLGVTAGDHETDAEYLERLLPTRLPPTPLSPDRRRLAAALAAAEALTQRTGQAQWSSTLPAGAAEAAEAAGAQVEAFLLAGLRPWRRGLVRVRGALAGTFASLRLPSRPRAARRAAAAAR